MVEPWRPLVGSLALWPYAEPVEACARAAVVFHAGEHVGLGERHEKVGNPKHVGIHVSSSVIVEHVKGGVHHATGIGATSDKRNMTFMEVDFILF